MASTSAQPLPRVRLPHRRVLWAIGVLLAAVGIAVGVDRAFFASGSDASPDRQGILDGLVSGPQRVAPGATAYVTGTGGSWAGAAGTANARTGEPMTPDARMRIESNSKIWLTAVVLQLAKEGKLSLDDSVARWLPGLLPYGATITLRQLLTDTSGLVDDFDEMFRSPNSIERALANVEDPKLRGQLAALVARRPATEVDPIWVIRLAAWQPLVFAPGSRYHHSNVGWKIAGLIAAKAGGKPLRTLYRERIIEPLGLTHSVYQPQGAIAGSHARSYSVGVDGSLTEAPVSLPGTGADGGVVTAAGDEATFVAALLDDRLGVRRNLLDLWGIRGRNGPGCPGDAVIGVGTWDAGRSYVYVDHTGNRVAVLLLNGARAKTVDAREPKAEAAARRLYCST